MTPRGFKRNSIKSDGYKQTTLVSYFSNRKLLNQEITSEAEKNTSLFTVASKVMSDLSITSDQSSTVITSERNLVRKIYRLNHVDSVYSQSQAVINENESTKSIQQYVPKLYTPIIPYKTYQKEYEKSKQTIIVESQAITPSKQKNVNTTSQICKTPTKIKCDSITPKKLKLSPKKERFSPEQKSLMENSGMTHVLKKIVDNTLAQSRFRALLAAHEEKQIKIFLNKNSFYQYFLCKLVTRKHVWYNIFKLVEDLKMNITESQIRKMYEELKETGYIKTDYSTEDLSFLLELLSKKEIIGICKTFRVLHKDLKKQDLINKLLSTVNCHQPYFTPIKSASQVLRENVNKTMGLCVKLHENFYNLLYKFYVLYFLTDYSSCLNITDWNYLMFQIEQNEIIYPKFNVDENVIIFTTKEEFEEYIKSYAHYQSALMADSKKQRALLLDLCKTAAQELDKLLIKNCEHTRDSNVRKFSAGYVYAHTISSNIDNLLCKYPKDMYELITCLLRQNLYKQSKRGYWYEKLAWIEWKYLKNHEQAVHTLTKALMDKTINEVAKHNLSQLGRKFKEMKNVNLLNSTRDEICLNVIDPPDHVPFKEVVINAVTDRENTSGKKRKYIVKNDDGERTYMTVEDVACSHYRKSGFPNITKCEGKFLVSLYCLSFWDIIYDNSVDGVFISKLQMYPLDFYSKQFYENRHIKIDQRLEDIESNWTKIQFKDFLNKICQNDPLALKLSEFVDDPVQLCEVIWCIGRQQFAKICRRFIDAFYLYNSGLPDLFMWSVEAQKAKFVEVKGEGDRLSIKQMLWLDFFRSIEVDAEVCYVHSTGSRGGHKYKKKIYLQSPEKHNGSW
ncbi:fanconi-associated nuclease 1 isoform X1 [Agrilus planipennis]|uniref:Fanconi-associated nuclease n=1 Tax=Agrilus planipennis TaxID=224129 RepID=A0A1W4WX13_AGRPL|nr:fanconi-associated nuclease 1 isoform X1 [Agrilus planipennis]XP_018325061.1 fanconi-associated nuclease 1 isoform X1 [Agrilus planipennis]XP_018325062.1 fanconi-associated nuclease 1 isoform X1 [Agrilus planipennis]